MNEPSDLPRIQLTTIERLIALVRRIMGQPATIRPLPIDARLSDLGISSIKMVNVMLAVETEFDITIPQGDINPENFSSLASVERLVLKLQLPASGMPDNPA